MVLASGEEPRTDAGLERLLHRDVVRKGELSPDVAKLFSRLQKYRQDADYTAEFVFTSAGASEEVAAAEIFVAAAKEMLARAVIT